MKKIISLGIILSLILGVTIVTAIAVKPINPSTEPIDSITFIHYADGRRRVDYGARPPWAGGGKPKEPKCYDLMGIKWKEGLPLSYVVHPDVEAIVPGAIFSSVEQWDLYTSTELFRDNGQTLDSSASFDDYTDGKNEYSYGDYPEEGVIAVCRTWYTRRGRQIVEYDVMFDTDFSFTDCETVNCEATQQMDLQNIATHETGHGIGLGDVYDDACSEATMYGFSWYGDIGKRDLAQPDITGLQKLYGV